MPHDEVDDTDMTPAQFRAAARRGQPVRIVTSKAAYEEALLELSAGPPRGLNLHLNLARVVTSTENELARAAQ